MTGEAIRLGPFTGGLNTASDPNSIEDEELTSCLNFELDIDGSLTCRPPIVLTQEGATDDYLYIFGSATFAGVAYLFATQGGATYVSSNEGASWTELNPGSLSRECVSMAVYQNSVWMPATPGSANGGISWNPGTGASAVADMPRGTACVVHKNRLYICPGEEATSDESRLEFSEAADFTIWSSSGSPGSASFIDVAQGNGDTLNNIIVYQDNLLLFKGRSTYVLAYDLDPADAILREINPVVGSGGSIGVVQHENTVYCLHLGNVYEIVNFQFELLNLKVPLSIDQTLPTNTDARYNNESLSLLGDRLVVRYFNSTMVFGLRTRTWSEWRRTDDTSTVEWHLFGPIIRARGLSSDEYFTSYSFDMNDTTGYKIFRIPDEPNAVDSEGTGIHTIECIATTKDFDMADPLRFKRLFWWGADLISGNVITADVQPISLQFSPTWTQLGDATIDELNTWGNPLEENSTTQSVVSADNIFTTSKMVKFLKAMRFRKINFSVMLVSDGTSLEPAKIFSYLAVVKTKQQVSAESS